MFFSLSKYPGKTGEYYYNTLFKKLNMPYSYTALECINLSESFHDMKKISKGFSVSMPYKKDILNYVDVIDPICATYSTCNTVLIRDGVTKGFTTDYYGALWIKSLIPLHTSVTILGDGSMGSLIHRVINTGEIVSRRMGNWEERYRADGIIINCTSYGTETSSSPFYIVPPVKMVIDLAIKDNQLKSQCEAQGIKYVGGIEFYKRQFIKQFEIYTGKEISLWEFENIQQ